MVESESIKRGPRFKDISGQRFGRLVVLRLDRMEKLYGTFKSFWVCRCDCAAELVVCGNNLRSGNTKSCGCFRLEVRATNTRTHGLSRSRLYNTWQCMIRRCCNPENPAYADYGGRGITVCDEWRNDFPKFLADMGHPPTRRHSLDRIDNDAGYCKENCRWATKQTQSRNSRRNVQIEFHGESHCVSEWAEIIGVDMHTLYNRLFILGWPIERALTAPIQGCRKVGRP